MPLPKTYLCQAPQSIDNQLGRCISSTDLIKKLKKCNKQLTVPTPEQYESQGWQFSPAHIEGQTSLWWGNPPGQGDIDRNSTKANRQAKKIVSFVLGPNIPEFTQFNSQTGLIEQKGWREIIRRVVMSGAASKEKVHKVFKVDLDYEGQERVCAACAKKGLRTKTTGGAAALCVDHEMATMGYAERQDYIDYLSRQIMTRGPLQVGYSGNKEVLCPSSPSPETKPRQKTSDEA